MTTPQVGQRTRIEPPNDGAVVLIDGELYYRTALTIEHTNLPAWRLAGIPSPAGRSADRAWAQLMQGRTVSSDLPLVVELP